MKKLYLWVAVFAGTAVIIACLWDALFFNISQPVTMQGYAMGSPLEVKMYGTSDQNLTQSVLDAITETEEKCLSPIMQSADIANINANAGVQLVEMWTETWELLSFCLDLAEQTDGAFNPVLGALIDLWGIGTDHPKVPSQMEIEKALLLCDYTSVEIKGNTVFLPKSGMKLNLGAVGKGAGCDAAIEVAKNDATGMLISLGGNIGAWGRHFRIALRDPEGSSSEHVGVFTYNSDVPLFYSTSGTYEKYFESDGKRYHHLLDPSTGYPAESNLLSVTVVSANGAKGDALSTACFVLPRERALSLLEKYDCEAVFVYKDKSVFCTEGLADMFQLTNQKYHYE